MKKEFWIKKDRTKDGPDNWEKMSSYEFARFMETADGKSRKENIARVPGGESGDRSSIWKLTAKPQKSGSVKTTGPVIYRKP